MAIVLPKAGIHLKQIISSIDSVNYSHPWLSISKGFEKIGFDIVIPVENADSIKTYRKYFFVPYNELHSIGSIEIAIYIIGTLYEESLKNLRKLETISKTKVLLLESLGTELKDSLGDVIDKFKFAYPKWKLFSYGTGFLYYLMKLTRAKKIEKRYELLFKKVDIIWLNTYCGAYSTFYSIFPTFSNKFFVHPFPVSPIFFKDPKTFSKQNTIVSVATRWNRIPKNYKGLNEILKMYDNYCKHNYGCWKFNIIGGWDKNCKDPKCVSNKFYKSQHFKTEFHGLLSATKLAEVFKKSKIILSTSISETYHSAIAEALVLGNSLVGPPIKSYHLFSLGGKSGLVAKRFNASELFEVLIHEINLHNMGLRDSVEIAKFWQKQLSPEASVENLIKFLRKTYGGYKV